jgi:hypothetical protein
MPNTNTVFSLYLSRKLKNLAKGRHPSHIELAGETEEPRNPSLRTLRGAPGKTVPE